MEKNGKEKKKRETRKKQGRKDVYSKSNVPFFTLNLGSSYAHESSVELRASYMRQLCVASVSLSKNDENKWPKLGRH